MASGFFNSPVKIKGFGGKEYNVPFYMQFVPGYCTEAIHSTDSPYAQHKNHINTIIAVPHHTDNFHRTRNSTSEDNRYFPLFRTMHDIPSKGDPVLLCTMGGTQYYLGPLNMPTNNPTWNDDLNRKNEYSVGSSFAQTESSNRAKAGESSVFSKLNLYSRMGKIYNPRLDGGVVDENNPAVPQTTGDFLIEGRHGNSVRVGSRGGQPNIVISNNRHHQNQVETLGDGSVISITSGGTLNDFFDLYLESEVYANRFDTPEGLIRYGFSLASDTLYGEDISTSDGSNQLKYISQRWVDWNNEDSVLDLYGYRGDQMLLHSDRITINSKRDDIFVSAKKDVYIGAGRHLGITTNNDITIVSDRLFLGDPYKERMQGMVLGQTLLEMLREILSVVKSAQGICQGAPIPLADETGSPGGVNQKITQIEQRIEEILSNKHMLASNE